MCIKLSSLSCAMAAALSLSAGSAFALPLGSAVDLMVNISGSSAQDNPIEDMFGLTATGVCASGTVDVYRQTPPTNYRMISCQLTSGGTSPVPAALQGKKIVVRKSSNGGSGNGVQPVADATAVNEMSWTASSGCTLQAVGPGVPFSNIYNCTNTPFDSVVPDAGISDEEPAFFGATPTELANLVSQSQAGVIFGIPVTLNLRNALQAAEGLTVGDDGEANMPSLTRTEIASLFSGNIVDWGTLADKDLNSLTSPTGDVAAAGITIPANTSVYIARRVDSSGTQHGARAYFLNAICANGVVDFVQPNDGSSATTGGSATTNCGTNTVFAGSGSNDVKACLNTDYTDGHWAIGIEGVEVAPKIGTDNWRFIKVNGWAPTLMNVEQSRYDYYMENSIQWRNSLSGNALSLMQMVAVQEASPTVLSLVDGAIGQVWGDTGFMALPTNGYIPPVLPVGSSTLTARNNQRSQLLADPVATVTKSPTGVTNNCQPPVPLFLNAPYQVQP